MLQYLSANEKCVRQCFNALNLDFRTVRCFLWFSIFIDIFIKMNIIFIHRKHRYQSIVMHTPRRKNENIFAIVIFIHTIIFSCFEQWFLWFFFLLFFPICIIFWIFTSLACTLACCCHLLQNAKEELLFAYSLAVDQIILCIRKNKHEIRKIIWITIERDESNFFLLCGYRILSE